jgi:hypothetical protein
MSVIENWLLLVKQKTGHENLKELYQSPFEIAGPAMRKNVMVLFSK